MLHILFLILKIIGIILLTVLGLALLVVGIVLFVPVRYRIEAETEDGIKKLVLHAKATWLLRFATAYVDYSDSKTEWKARLAWKKFPQTKVQETAVPETVTETTTKKKTNFIEKIRYTIQTICDKIKKIWETKDRILEYISNEVHQVAFGKVMTQFWELCKHLKPKKLKGQVHFGLEEPYDTGRVLAVLSMLYPFYGDRIQIDPDFEEEVLEGHVSMSGRIRISRLLVILCKLYFDKDVKTAYENFRRK